MNDLAALKSQSTPEVFARELRGRGKIFWSEPERIWVVTDHQLGQSLIKHPAMSADRSGFFQAQMSGCPFHKVMNFFGVVKNMMVNSDGEEHARRRALAQSGINDHVLDRFADQVPKVVGELLKSIEGKKTVDFAEAIALPLPNIILADLFQVPEENRRDFYRWSNQMTQLFGGGSTDILKDAENGDAAAVSLREFFGQVIDKRRIENRDDFIGHLVRAQGNMGDDEVISQAVIMLVAGTVTTTDQICNNLYGLLTSGVWELLVKDPSLLPKALEEVTRLDPAVNFIFRAATEDINVEGAEIKKGQLVFVSTHAANRTEEVFPAADEIQLNRVRNPHLAYGVGSHYCLGARLGRMQMTELFSQLLKEYPNLKLDGGASALRKHQSLGFSGFETLPVVLEAL